MNRRCLYAALYFAMGSFAAVSASARAVEPLRIAVDASQAPQEIYRVNVTMPAAPGPFTFVYPKWIPGYHGPVGPFEGVVSLRVSAKGLATPLQMIISNDDFFRVVAVDARDGERFPQLARQSGAKGVLAKIYAPTTLVPLPEPSAAPAIP